MQASLAQPVFHVVATRTRFDGINNRDVGVLLIISKYEFLVGFIMGG